jgi:hypothetical protein
VWLVDGGESRRRTSGFGDVVEPDYLLEEQVDEDFGWTRLRTFLRWIWARLRNKLEAKVTEFCSLLSTGSITPRIEHNHARLETSTEKGAKTVDASRIMASYSQQ